MNFAEKVKFMTKCTKLHHERGLTYPMTLLNEALEDDLPQARWVFIRDTLEMPSHLTQLQYLEWFANDLVSCMHQ
jgi:hypothetical protein